jgi:hypothetical protein
MPVSSEIEAFLCQGYPAESRSNEIVILLIIFTAVTFPIAGLKFYSRWATSHGFEWDDYAAALATVSFLPSQAISSVF